jgi:hypothetical protein
MVGRLPRGMYHKPRPERCASDASTSGISTNTVLALIRLFMRDLGDCRPVATAIPGSFGAQRRGRNRVETGHRSEQQTGREARKRSPDHTSGSGSIRPKVGASQPIERSESGRPKLPHPVKVGHPDRANKAVPVGWMRRIVDERFANAMKGSEHWEGSTARLHR